MRIFVLTAFALTLWLAGPRAVEVTAARIQQASEQSPLVALDHVGFVEEPSWLRGPLLLAVLKDLGPALQDEVPILDQERSAQLQRELGRSPWVRRVGLHRQFPNRFRLELDLRRPVVAVRSGADAPLCLADRDGVALPWVADTGLPVVRLYREGGSPTMRGVVGEVVSEARVVAAAGVAVEWRDEVRPLVEACPELLEIDATNLGERWMRGRSYPEVRVHLRRDDGGQVIFAYGRPVGSSLPRVSAQTKAWVLGQVLERHPGLRGLDAGELRLKNRWSEYLHPRPPGARDPDGGWGALDLGLQPVAPPRGR